MSMPEYQPEPSERRYAAFLEKISETLSDSEGAGDAPDTIAKLNNLMEDFRAHPDAPSDVWCAWVTKYPYALAGMKSLIGEMNRRSPEPCMNLKVVDTFGSEIGEVIEGILKLGKKYNSIAQLLLLNPTQKIAADRAVSLAAGTIRPNAAQKLAYERAEQFLSNVIQTVISLEAAQPPGGKFSSAPSPQRGQRGWRQAAEWIAARRLSYLEIRYLSEPMHMPLIIIDHCYFTTKLTSGLSTTDIDSDWEVYGKGRNFHEDFFQSAVRCFDKGWERATPLADVLTKTTRNVSA